MLEPCNASTPMAWMCCPVQICCSTFSPGTKPISWRTSKQYKAWWQPRICTFQLIDERLKSGLPVGEVEVQQRMVETLHGVGLEFDHPPIVAFGSHSSDGHYAPSPQSDRMLEMGQPVLIDLWAGFKDRPMADITWVGFAGGPTRFH